MTSNTTPPLDPDTNNTAANNEANEKESRLNWWARNKKGASIAYYVMPVPYFAILFIATVGLWIGLKNFAGLSVDSFSFVTLIMVFFAIKSMRIIGPDEQAALLLLGKPIRDLSSGPVFVPWLLCSIKRFPTKRIQFAIPKHELLRKIYTSKDDKGEDDVVVVRIITADRNTMVYTLPPKPDFKPDQTTEEQEAWEKMAAEDKKTYDNLVGRLKGTDNPLHDQLTIEPEFIGRFTIWSPMRFVQTGGTIAEAVRDIAATIVAAAQAEFAKLTPLMLLCRIPQVNALIHRRVEILIGEEKNPETGKKDDPWGINFNAGYVDRHGISRTVNVAMAALREASFNRKNLKLQGEGLGAKEKAFLTGRAAGLQKMAKAVSSPGGELSIQMDTLQKTVNPAAQVFMTGGDLTTAVMGTILAGKTSPVHPPRLSSPPSGVEPKRSSSPEKKPQKEEDGEDHKE
ncbi:MAG: hypothetical protein AAB534_00605 [Patescibacteria group bacterium]